MIINNTFPNRLKNVYIKPFYKKDDPFDKTNYRPISILSVLCKTFERWLYDQIYEYIDTILSKVKCGLRKDFIYLTFISVIFFVVVEEDNVTSYCDDRTPYSKGKNVVTVLENI